MNLRSADLATGLVLILLGIAMVWGGFVMERLEVRAIHPASIPGLVPMGIGGAIIFCGILLFVSSYRGDDGARIDFGDKKLLFWTAVLCSGYALLLVGNLPFFWATFLFISGATARFRWRADVDLKSNGKEVMFSMASGLVFSGLITLLFRYAFLVRLP